MVHGEDYPWRKEAIPNWFFTVKWVVFTLLADFEIALPWIVTPVFITNRCCIKKKLIL
jgi:hypothetical protein